MTASAALGDPRDGVRLTPAAPEMRVSFADPARHEAATAEAAAVLRREGVVVLDQLIDPALLETCHREIEARYPDHATPDPLRYLGSYPGRHTAPMVINGTLAEPQIFAHPVLRALDTALLGSEHVLESFGLLVSLTGSPDQGRHFDGLLFAETKLDMVLPPVALSIAIPLVPLGEVNGTTAFWRRSHREPFHAAPPDFAPQLPLGSALVWDFRTHHSGRGNLGDAPRPVLFAVHSRDWWMEPRAVSSSGYKKLLLAQAVQDSFGRRLRAFTVRAEIVP